MKSIITLTVRPRSIASTGYVIEIEVWNQLTEAITYSGFTMWEAAMIWLGHTNTDNYIIRIRSRMED